MRAEELLAACDAAGFCALIREQLDGMALEEFLDSVDAQMKVGFAIGQVVSCFQTLQGLARKSGNAAFDGISKDLWETIRHMRNRVTHEYMNLISAEIFRFSKKEIPMFETELRMRIARSGLDCVEADATRHERFFRR